MPNILKFKKLKTMLKTALSVVILNAVVVAGAHAELVPDEVVTELSTRNDAVIERLQRLAADDKLTAKSALRVIRREMSPIIDFKRLAQLATGKYWRRATEKEKEEITEEFRLLLESTYAKVLSKYSDQKVTVLEAKPRADGTVIAGVEVKNAEGQSARIDYVFYEKDGSMKITDVQVESISLLDTYRRQFAQIAKEEGIAGLIERLKQLALR